MTVPQADKAGHEILVLGATGKQGGATARRLLERGWQVRAFVRDPGKAQAVELAALGATLHTGDLEDADSIRRAMTGVYGVFSVQTPLGPAGVPGEERHGKLVADIAADFDLKHYVHSSVGGAERPEGLHWREAKLRVEERVLEHGLPATFLRPAYFMENLNADMYPPVLEDGGLVYRRGLADGVKLQMIAAADIGVFAAQTFDAGPEEAVGRHLELAGDELTGAEIAAAFARHTGLSARYEAVPPDDLVNQSHWQVEAYGWLNRIGYSADISMLRQAFPELQTLDGWLASTEWKVGAPAAA